MIPFGMVGAEPIRADSQLFGCAKSQFPAGPRQSHSNGSGRVKRDTYPRARAGLTYVSEERLTHRTEAEEERRFRRRVLVLS